MISKRELIEILIECNNDNPLSITLADKLFELIDIDEKNYLD